MSGPKEQADPVPNRCENNIIFLIALEISRLCVIERCINVNARMSVRVLYMR